MDRKDDTMNLDELRKMLSDVPDTGAFDLDSIIAEVEGLAPPAPANRTPEPSAWEPRQKTEPQPKPEPPAGQQQAAVRPEPEEKARPYLRPVPDSDSGPSASERRAMRRQPEEAETQDAPRRAARRRPAEEEPPRTAPKARRRQQAAPVDDEASGEEYDPRAARIAAREAKAAARREKSAARRPDADAGMEDAGPARARKMTRKEAKAARIAAEQAEEAEGIELRDPMEAARGCKRRARGLGVRAFFVLLAAAGAAYLSIAPNFEQLPVPVVIDVIENPSIAIGVLMLLQCLALLLGIDVFGMGFYSLFHGAPDRCTLVSISVLAALLHGASIIVFDNQTGTDVPYLAVNILMLYAAMREERNRFSAQGRAYQAICSAEQPMAVYSHYDRGDDSCRAVKGPLHGEESFLLEMERPDTVDRFAMIYVPVALAASVIFSLIASVGRGEPERFFWAFSAILSVSAPLGLLCAFGAAYKNVSHRLLGAGAAIAGARQANLLRGTEEVVLSENDLFPAGSISLEALQNMGQVPDDKILACAAALADTAGLELGRVLSDATRERYGVTLSARDVRIVEGGVAGVVGSSRVVLGTAELMVKLGVRLRAGQGGRVNAYLLVDNTLAGVLTLRYQPTKSTYQAMRLMRRMHMNAMLAVQDFNISPAMVESQFDLRHHFADQPAPAEAERLLDPSYTEGDAPAAILTREGAGPLVQVLRCADKLAGSVRSSLTLGTFAGICGMLIVFYLVYQNAVEALPVMHLLLYLLIWYVPVFLITQQTH